jgi:hypothetical protein
MKSVLTQLLTVALVAGLWPSLASAEGFTDWRKVAWVYQRQCSRDEGFEIQLGGPHDNPDGCSNSRTIQVQCFVPNYSEVVDIALTAMSTNGQLRAFANGCDKDGHAIVKALQARPPAPPAE